MLSETPWKRNRRSNKCLPTDEGLTNDNLCGLSLDPRVPDHGTGQKKTVVNHRLFVMEAVKRRQRTPKSPSIYNSDSSPSGDLDLSPENLELCSLSFLPYSTSHFSSQLSNGALCAILDFANDQYSIGDIKFETFWVE
ncbi:unnamed protein product [Ilex paraguariensis]|uniref:Uncharacterized protein n=1 Tax=Ilex paraguariensis TaxID=185542 RepID=A0ABC8QNW3_9AQUA